MRRLLTPSSRQKELSGLLGARAATNMSTSISQSSAQQSLWILVTAWHFWKKKKRLHEWQTHSKLEAGCNKSLKQVALSFSSLIQWSSKEAPYLLPLVSPLHRALASSTFHVSPLCGLLSPSLVGLLGWLIRRKKKVLIFSHHHYPHHCYNCWSLKQERNQN